VTDKTLNMNSLRRYIYLENHDLRTRKIVDLLLLGNQQAPQKTGHFRQISADICRFSSFLGDFLLVARLWAGTQSWFTGAQWLGRSNGLR
jgi:hypothetical protein